MSPDEEQSGLDIVGDFDPNQEDEEESATGPSEEELRKIMGL